MLAECVKRFRDFESWEIREEGDQFEVTEKRLEAINSTKYGTLAIKVEQPEKATRQRAEKKD